MTGRTPAASGRIDVHAHFVPAGYRAAAHAAGHEHPDGFPALPAWSAAEHVAAMDRLGIATSLLSISSPGVHFGDDAAARDLAREVNEEGRRTVLDHPGRFGLLAALPLPDVDGTIAEIAHCADRLDVDGVSLLTNAGGTYLGDAMFDPVFAELDRRRARVVLHPTSPACWERTSLGRPRPMIEFLFDTTRAVVDLVLSGTIARHPGIEWVVPHAGATLPMIADRVATFRVLLADVDPRTDVAADLARLHYDLAGFPGPRQLDALLAIAVADHLHFGSDYPFTPEFAVAHRLAPGGDGDGDGASHDAGTPGPGARTPSANALAANTRRLFPRLDRTGDHP